MSSSTSSDELSLLPYKGVVPLATELTKLDWSEVDLLLQYFPSSTGDESICDTLSLALEAETFVSRRDVLITSFREFFLLL